MDKIIFVIRCLGLFILAAWKLGPTEASRRMVKTGHAFAVIESDILARCRREVERLDARREGVLQELRAVSDEIRDQMPEGDEQTLKRLFGRYEFLLRADDDLHRQMQETANLASDDHMIEVVRESLGI